MKYLPDLIRARDRASQGGIDLQEKNLKVVGFGGNNRPAQNPEGPSLLA